MPPKKSGPAPEQSTPNLPALRSAKVWETGEAPDEGRIPGTRRLWLAGALALAVVSSCVTALYMQDSDRDDTSQDRTGRTTAAGDSVVPDLPLPEASPTTPPEDKSGLSTPQSSKESSKDESDGSGTSEDDSDSSSESQQGGAKPKPEDPEPSKPATSSKPPASTSSRKAVRSVNYPDRYWHLRNGTIQLDQVSSHSGSETREDSSFKVVSGLANSSCYSFRMEDGRYVRHQNFVLRAARHDGSQLFKQDATFCPRSSYNSGAVMLESVNYPGHFVRQRNFELRLERYDQSRFFFADSTFQLVKAFSS